MGTSSPGYLMTAIEKLVIRWKHNNVTAEDALALIREIVKTEEDGDADGKQN